MNLEQLKIDINYVKEMAGKFPGSGIKPVATNAQVEFLLSEVARLKSGDWKPDEVHDICHNLKGTVPLEEFVQGCRLEQLRLYGKTYDNATIIDLKKKLIRAEHASMRITICAGFTILILLAILVIK